DEKVFVLSSRRRHTISKRDWSSDVCSSDLERGTSISREESMMQKKSSFSQPSIESIHERNVPEKGYPYRGVGDIPAGISLQEPRSEERRVGKQAGQQRADSE